MKKLIKIKLINWYTFLDTDIEIKNNSLVTGMNGSGKSTLLDAIQYVLTGGKVKFNQATGETSKRTVESYIRAKLGLEGREYLRTGDVTSYICLEFYDEEKDQHDLLGVVLELPAISAKANRLFFKFSNKCICDDLFKDEDYIKTIFKFKQNDVKEKEFTDYSNEFRRIVRSFLGVGGNDKYFDLLIKSLYFKPINNINEFVNNFLLAENNISLEYLKQNVENLTKLLNDIELEEEKVEALELLVGKINDYDNKLNEREKLFYFLNLIEKEELLKNIENNQKKVNDNKSEIEILINKKVDKDKEIRSIKDRVIAYDKSLKEDDNYILMNSLENRLEELKNCQLKLGSKVKEFGNIFEKEKKALKNFECGKELNKNIDKNDFYSIEKILNNCRNVLEKEKNSLLENKLSIAKDKDNAKKNLDDTNKKIDLLKAKKRPYKDEVISLQKEIKNYFINNYGKDIEIRPLCEYLEVTNEKWRNAIEGYLNTQKFDLIVEPEYFDEALAVYEKEKNSKHISGVGLVNVIKFLDMDISSNTLANYIESDNNYAKRYAVYLLNKVVCCDNIDDLKKYPNSITDTCMTYRNNVARQINPFVYKFHYIGNKAILQQLEIYNNMVKDYEDSYNELLKNYSDINNNLDVLKNSEIGKLLDLYPNCCDYYKLKAEYLSVKKEKDSIVMEGLFNNILKQKEELEKEIRLKEKEINDILEKKIGFETVNDNLEKIVNENKKCLQEINDNLNINEDWNKLFVKGMKSSDIENKIHELNGEIKFTEATIVQGQKDYNEKYQFDEIPKIENNDSYKNELSRKKELELVKYKSQSSSLKEQCEITFREDFLIKLKDNIEVAQEEIRRLNKALKGKPFGKEHYEFVWNKSENKELANYYRIIMSGSNYQINTLFDETLSIQDRKTLDELFNRLCASGSLEEANKLIEEYTDYRNYMSYDIKISKDDGDSYLFSKVSKEKSGGEVQTPFYVIIASAFEQLLHSINRKSSNLCFVMFDEAFNNMDEKRIEAMMDFYNRLNIQLMIAVPPERLPFIEPHVDTTLVLISDKEVADVKSIIREKAHNE